MIGRTPVAAVTCDSHVCAHDDSDTGSRPLAVSRSSTGTRSPVCDRRVPQEPGRLVARVVERHIRVGEVVRPDREARGPRPRADSPNRPCPRSACPRSHERMRSACRRSRPAASRSIPGGSSRRYRRRRPGWLAVASVAPRPWRLPRKAKPGRGRRRTWREAPRVLGASGHARGDGGCRQTPFAVPVGPTIAAARPGAMMRTCLGCSARPSRRRTLSGRSRWDRSMSSTSMRRTSPD